MDLVPRVFLFDPASIMPLLDGLHDPWLVALSVLVAVVTSYVALALSDRFREAPTTALRLGAHAAGALSLGGGVWTMHFIGMLAFQLCARVEYDPVWTIGSILPSLGAAWVALRGLGRARVTGRKLLLGGVWMGSGIGLMHYGGMAAVRSSATLRYDPAWFAASIVVAVALSCLAVWMHHRLRRHLTIDRRLRTLLAAAVLGGAISGMHYTAMGAARFQGTPEFEVVAQTPMRLQLAMGVALIALVLSVAAVGANAALMQRQLMRDRVRSEVRLQALVDTAVDGVVRMDGEGRIVAVNAAAEGIFGLREAELLGRPLAEHVPALTDQLSGVIESPARRSDGRELRLRLALGHSDPGGEPQRVAFVSDITEARRRQAELEGVQEAIHRALVVVEFDVNGIVIDANDAFLALTAHTRETLIGRHHRILCHPDEAAGTDYAEHWAALRRGEFRTGDYERIGYDGRRIWIRATYNPILDADGRALRIVKFVSDLTERHVLEQDLRQAKVRAEQAASAKSTFLANMSHEIRTPMNAIIGFSEVVLDGPLEDAARQHLQVIHRSARSLLGLLNDILDTAKLDHGALELESRDFSLPVLCSDVLATLRVQAKRKGLALTLAIDADVPDHHRGDPMRLQQILLNLVGNAVKFTEQGSVTLAVRRPGAGELEWSVQDTGIGIAADRLEHIFDPFAQADASMTRRFGGTGLGTTIARQLVQLMGGEIGVESRPGEGSRFWFRLPLRVGRPPQKTRTAADATPLPPLRILAADDVVENLRLLELRLGALGHTVTTARDGEEALERLQTGGFDIALLDVQMPRLDGMQACRRHRAHEAGQGRARLPILALTASAGEEDRERARDAGMDGFVIKPIDWPLLLGEMARVLGIAAAADAAGPALAGPSSAATGVSGRPELPEAVDWPQAMARWGSLEDWRAPLRRFLAGALAAWPAGSPDAAFAHRLRGACANFALGGLAEVCAALERDAPDGHRPWSALHARLLALKDALGPEAASPEPVGPAAGSMAATAWPAESAAALRAALARGELPEAAYREVLHALPGRQRDALRQAVDDFDFDAAQAVIDRCALETP